MLRKTDSLVNLLKSYISKTRCKCKMQVLFPTKQRIGTYVKDFNHNSTTPTTEQLRSSLENLPLELYDEIKSLTLDLGSTTQNISPYYLPPITLQLDRFHRQSFSEVYYSNESIFKFHNSSAGIVIFSKWIESLSEQSLEFLQQQYGTMEKAILEDAVDVQLEISRERRLRVWCDEVDQKWVQVLRICIFED